MAYSPERRERPPLDKQALENAAVHYAGRFATTRAKLKTYLVRKLRERGWSGEGSAPVDAIVERMASLGYVDDRAFASARAAALSRRGYGERRVDVALRVAGIDDEDGVEARAIARDHAWAAALRFAERKKIGPFAAAVSDRAGREKALGAMLRAGHSSALSRRLVDATPGIVPEEDIA